MFDQIVFAGGGNRCWWQAGFWDIAQPALGLRPRVITGISTGAATACMLYTRDAAWVMRYYEEALRHNRKNAYWGNLFGREPVFPHYRIYRQALLDIYGEPFAKLAAAPEIRIGVSHVPRWLGARSSGRRPRRVQHRKVRAQDAAPDARAHARLSAGIRARAGLRERRRARRPDPAVVLHAAVHAGAAPRRPARAGRRDGRQRAGRRARPAPGDVLVLVTRLYPRPQMFTVAHGEQRRLYVQPSSKVPISSWDYTSPSQMRHAYDLGRRDGEHFLTRVGAMTGGRVAA